MNPAIIMWIETLIILLLGLIIWPAVTRKNNPGDLVLIPAEKLFSSCNRLPIRQHSLMQRPPGCRRRHLYDDPVDKQLLFFTNWDS